MKVIKSIIFYAILVIMALSLFFSILCIFTQLILQPYVFPTFCCSVILFFFIWLYRDSKKSYSIDGLRRLFDGRIIYYRYDILSNRLYCRLWGEYHWHLLGDNQICDCLRNQLSSYNHFKYLNNGKCRLDDFLLFLDRLLINNSIK